MRDLAHGSAGVFLLLWDVWSWHGGKMRHVLKKLPGLRNENLLDAQPRLGEGLAPDPATPGAYRIASLMRDL